MISWEFAPTYGSDDDGFSDAFIEAFMGDVDKSLARETIQNSLDARLDFNHPVVVEFNRIECGLDLVPGIEDLKIIFSQCLEYFPDDKKVKNFFTNALQIVSSQNFTILKISDFNTVGLRGEDDDNRGEWYCLIKAQGASSKQEEKLGSFGIGKGAPFAASAFRTVFYSTVNDKNVNVFQGKARLVSHKNGGSVKRGIGSYGLTNYSSIREQDLIPKFYQRRDRGTDIFILAYRGVEKVWSDNLIKSVLENYWAAIFNKDLIVKVGEKVISFDSLESDLIKYFGPEDSESPYPFYSAFTNPTQLFENNLSHLGACKFYVTLQEKAPKKVAMMRRSRMLIKLKSFRSPKPFIGVFICDDHKGNEILRDLEPPQHNDWEPKRMENGVKVLKEMEDWIRGCLRTLTTTEDTDVTTIPGLEKYFQLPEDSDFEGDIENYFDGEYKGSETVRETAHEFDKKTEITKIPVVTKHHEPVINPTQMKNSGNKKRIRSGKTTSGNGKSGTGENEGKVKTINEIDCITRSFLVKQTKDSCEYLLILKPAEDFEGDVKISISADDTNYPAELLKVVDFDNQEEQQVSERLIKNLKLNKDIKRKFSVTIKSKNKVSLITG